MNIKILGTKGEVELNLPRHRKQSGVLIDNALLLDLGDKRYLKYAPQWIVITHLHPDHAYFVRRGHEEDPATKASIFAPEKLKAGIQVLKRKRKLGPYTITPIPTHHSKYVKSQAYLIQKGKKSILYTGDLIWIDKKYHPLFENVDLVITEASFIREGGMIRKDPKTKKIYGHAGVPNLIRLFQPHTEKILLTHFGSWFLRNAKSGRKKLRALSQKYKVKIVVVHDGMSLKV